jgi:urease accessory protein
MPNILKTTAGGTALALLLAAPALAHPGHGEASFAQGLLHPFSGLDHLLAMLSVGLWASLRGGRALWVWPAGFLVAMLAGFELGQTGPALSLVEPAVLASVIALGTLTAAAARLPLAPGVAMIAACGLAHGYAHGVEAPGAGAEFPFGFVISTAALHLMGVAAGLALAAARRPQLVRVLGGGAVVGGFVLALV